MNQTDSIKWVNIRKNITNQTEDEYDNIKKVNVDSTYILCKLFKPMLMNVQPRKEVLLLPLTWLLQLGYNLQVLDQPMVSE
jgi:hypothetical protein